MDSEVVKQIAKDKVSAFAKKQMIALLSSIGCLPLLLAIFIIVIVIIIIGGDSEASSGNNTSYASGTCSYNVNGQTVSNIKVRLLNCEGNTPVAGEDLIDFETYITGVVYQENSNGGYEALKAQAIAARSYALTRPKQMGNAVGISLKEENGQWILSLRSCTNDQAFCHPDKGCWSNTCGGDAYDNCSEPKKIAPTEERTIHSGYDSSKNWKRGALAEDSQVRQAVKETAGQVLLNSKGNIVVTGFKQEEQTIWNNLATEGKDYFSILAKTYSSATKIDSNCISSSSLGDSANIDVASIKSNNNIDKIFKGNFENLLEENNTTKEEYNKYIYTSVREAGLGTRSGVAAAAISIIDYMSNMGYKIRYDWGSGYSGYGVKNLGESGFDCSHFVAWAIHNGGHDYNYYTSAGYEGVGKKCRRTDKDCNGQVGDLIWHDGHIMLIVGVDAENYYIAHAQSTGAGIKLVKDKKYKDIWSSDKDYIIDMTDYYSKHVDTSNYPE